MVALVLPPSRFNIRNCWLTREGREKEKTVRRTLGFSGLEIAAGCANVGVAVIAGCQLRTFPLCVSFQSGKYSRFDACAPIL